MAVTIVRTATSSQIGALLTQASASTTYLTQSSASTTYATKASPTFTGTVNTAAINMNGSLNLNNYNLNQVGNLEFNDPGVGEGISWLGGNLWKIYESPNDLITNSAGNLQIVQNATRRLTIDTAGELFVSNSIAIGDNTTSTAARYLQIGPGRTDSGYAYIDLVGDTTYTDYGARFLRGNTGSNTYTNLVHKGTGALQLIAENAGSITLGTNNITRMTINSAGDTTFTGTVSGSTAAVDTNTTQLATTAYVVGQAYAKLASPTFTGTVVLPSTTSIGTVTSTELGYVYGVTSAIQTQINEKLSLSSASTTYATKAGNLSQFGATTSAQLLGVLSDETGTGSAVFNTSPTFLSSVSIGNSTVSTADQQLQIGNGRTGNGASWVDLVSDTTYPDYGLRVLRNAGANATSQLIHSGSGQFNVLCPNGGTIGLSTSNVNRLVIDASGIVTKPAQPYFHARSTQATAVGNDVFWSTIDNNSGSYYNATNGRFTAPVAGTYFLSAHGLWNNADAGDMRIALYKNGAGINGNRFILTKTASNWMTFYLNDIIYLAAGDYVTVRYLQGTNTLHVDADYNGFRGWLLG
jgi:hypothetical protein